MTSDAQKFRLFSQVCTKMATETGADHRTRLLEMADAWDVLAEEAERFAQLVRDVDKAFDNSSPQEFLPLRRTH